MELHLIHQCIVINVIVSAVHGEDSGIGLIMDKIITGIQQNDFMRQLEKDYNGNEKPLLVIQNNREYWLFTEIWQRCTDFFNSLEPIKGDKPISMSKPNPVKGG